MITMSQSFRSPLLLTPCCYNPHQYHTTVALLLRKHIQPCSSLLSLSRSAVSTAARASTSGRTQDGIAAEEGKSSVVLDDDEVISLALSCKDASEVLRVMAEISKSKSVRNGGRVVSCMDCCRIMKAALQSNNSELALSVFGAMRSSAFHQVQEENGGFVERWKWPRPDVDTYTTLIIGLAASLRVSDSLKIVEDICRVGLSSGDEVPFGKIVRCPSCLIAVAVAQPQQGIQIASCAKCRYQYELISGDIVTIASEEIRISS